MTIIVLTWGFVVPLGCQANASSDRTKAMQTQAAIVIGTAAIFATAAVIVANSQKGDVSRQVVVYQ